MPVVHFYFNWISLLLHLNPIGNDDHLYATGGVKIANDVDSYS